MNIKKLFICILLLTLQITCLADRRGKMVICGNECEYDTLVHRTIAPGAELLQLQFDNILDGETTYKMRTHIITIDLTNPYISFTPYLAKNKYFELSKQTDEISRFKQNGVKAVASVDGGGFVMANHASATATANEMLGSLITNREVKYESYGSRINSYLDGNKECHIGVTAMQGQVSANGTSFTIGQINHCRDVVDDQELLTLFCNGMGKSRAVDANTGTDVRVKLLNDSKKIVTGENIQCEVVSVMNSSCNSFEEGEAILSGVGKAATFLQTLAKGEIVTINLSYVDSNNNVVDVQDQVSNLLGYYIKDGEIVTNTQRNTALCAIGNSKDGKTVYWVDMEMTSNSNAPAECFQSLLKNIGMYDAMSLDGGPSAEMTVDGKYITVNSIPNFEGRYIPSGYIIYSTAPDDDVITHLELLDPSEKTMFRGDSLKLNLYAYNQYGEMILSDAQTSPSVEISCTSGLGTIQNGVFFAEQLGSGNIYIKLAGGSDVITVPVTVVEKHVLAAYPQKIFTGEGRACQIKLTYSDDNGSYDVAPSDATWTKTGKFVIESCENGCVIPYADGVDDVIATYNGISDTISVEVENLAEVVECIDLSDKIFNNQKYYRNLPSVPTSFTVRLSGTVGETATIYYTLGYNKKSASASGTIGDDGTLTLVVYLDYNDVETYPVEVLEVDGESVELEKLYANYKTVAEIKNITDDSNSVTDNYTYNLAGQRVNAKYAKGILIKNGKKIVVR